MDSTYSLEAAKARRGTLVGQVMGLLAFSLLFTAGGAIIGPRLGVGGLILGLVGSIGCLIALYLVSTSRCSTVSACSRESSSDS
jgi:hypothetical protein